MRLLGGDPWRDAAALHRRLAYVPGDVNLWPDLTGGEVIDLLGRLRGGLDPRRRADLLERFGLDPTRKSRTYSKGNRQKVALIAALASDVELLVLDEPTSGLDPLMEKVFRDCIEGERARGRTVLLSSHILSEVEALCDRVTIIKDGHAIDTGTLAELRHLTRTHVEAELAVPAPADLARLPGVHDADVSGHRFVCEVDTAALGDLLGRLSEPRDRQPDERPTDPRGALPAALPGAVVTSDRVGTRTCLRLVLRRDRILLPVWLVVLAAVAASSAAATVGIYPTAAARRAAAEAVNAAPALVALYGRIYDPSNLGGIAMLKMTGFGGVLVAILMALTVIRHTRGDEEAGRTELMRAGVLGRQAPLLATLILTLGASLLLGLLTALGLMAAGLETRGAWAFGLVVGLRRRGVRRGGRRRRAAHGQRPRGEGHRHGGAGGVVLPAGGRRHLLRVRPALAVVALTDRLGPADPPVRGRPLVGRPGAPRVRPGGGRRGPRPAGPARPRRRAGPAPARPGHRRPRPQHAAGAGVAAAARLVPGLAGRLLRAGLRAGQHGLASSAGCSTAPGPRTSSPGWAACRASPTPSSAPSSARPGWSPRRTACSPSCACTWRSRPCAPSRCSRPPSAGRPGWPATWWWRWPRRRP